jgi:hypothetical protein
VLHGRLLLGLRTTTCQSSVDYQFMSWRYALGTAWSRLCLPVHGDCLLWRSERFLGTVDAITFLSCHLKSRVVRCLGGLT